MATNNKRKRMADTAVVDEASAVIEEVPTSAFARKSGPGLYTNKQRVLILSSRGITARYRHLMEDLKKLIPHHKKDNKLDAKGDIHVVNEIAELKSCNQVLYLETKKNQDLYMYLGKTPLGPSVKFHVANVHTMDELKLTGNCMIGSRPLLNFDASFDAQPHLQLLKSKSCNSELLETFRFDSSCYYCTTDTYGCVIFLRHSDRCIRLSKRSPKV